MWVHLKYKRVNMVFVAVFAVVIIFSSALTTRADVDADNVFGHSNSYSIIARWEKGYKETEQKLIDNNCHNKRISLDVAVRMKKGDFDAKEARPQNMINGDCRDKDGKIIEFKYDEDYTYCEEKGESIVYHCRYIFDSDGQYNGIYVQYTGKSNQQVKTSPVSFLIDTCNPECGLRINKSKTKMNKKIVFTLSGLKDDSSGINWEGVKYGISEKYDVSSVRWKKLPPNNRRKIDLEIKEADLKGIVSGFYMCVRIEDNAGNYKYIFVKSQTIDNTKPVIKNYKIVTKPCQYKNNSNEIYYNADKIRFKFDVIDAGNDKTGISDEIEYKVNDSRWRKAHFDRFTDGSVSAWFILDSSQCNGNGVRVAVRAKDDAGNYSEEEVLKLNIDTQPPLINIKFNNNECKMVSGNRGYFAAPRIAEIIITEKNFDYKTAQSSIEIFCINKITGEKVKDTQSNYALVSAWKSVGEDAYKANVNFNNSCNYEFKVSYTDNAGNKNSKIVYGNGTAAPEYFTVDMDKPDGKIIIKENKWWENRFGRELIYAVFSKERLKVTITQKDATGKLKNIKYFKSSKKRMLSKSELMSMDSKKWIDYKGEFSVNKNERAVIYARLEDYSGNIRFISSEGIIADDAAPGIAKISPEIDINAGEPVNGIYNDDVKVLISVEEPVVNEVISGIRQIRYEVLNMGKITQQGILFSKDNGSYKADGLMRNWSGSIIVDKRLNNSNDVVVSVYAEDNAGNCSYGVKSIKIDATPPLITVKYDNNIPESGNCYKCDRIATVTITERNFNPDDVNVMITNTDGYIPSISRWDKVPGMGNQDDTVYRAVIRYSEDGCYKFEIAYGDLAGNECRQVAFEEGTVNPHEFVIDKTEPLVTVSYDNNSVKNGKYFNAPRKASILVREHNFDAERVRIDITSSLNGALTEPPVVSWTDNGDNHIGTVIYSKDGDYTFDIAISDKAGNIAGKVTYTGEAGKEFTIDTKIDKPSITGVENGMSYNGDVKMLLEFEDDNFDNCMITLMKTYKDCRNEDVTEKFIKSLNIHSNGMYSENDTFEKLRINDGIYTLGVRVWDKAGNDETEYVRFTINRFGSVYEYNDYAVSLDGKYIKDISGDIIITEYNPDPIVNDSLKIQVTCDNTPINDLRYKVFPQIDDATDISGSGWYQYQYVIAASEFEKDGIYKIAVASEDKAGNMSETSDYGNGDISFIVDTTPVEFTSIKGLEQEIVNAKNHKVDYEVFDSIGIKNVKVYVDGEEVQNISRFDNVINYKGSFIINEGAGQKVRLIAEDLAGNITDTDSDKFVHEYKFNNHITISTNILVRWYADKVLFYAGIAIILVVLLSSVSIFNFVRKSKRKKNLLTSI